MRLAFLPPARREMFRAASRYDSESPGLGSRFLDAVRPALAAIGEYPSAHPPIDDQTRRILLARFPYVLVYRIDGNGDVIILAVAHTSRKPGYWRRRKGAQ